MLTTRTKQGDKVRAFGGLTQQQFIQVLPLFDYAARGCGEGADREAVGGGGATKVAEGKYCGGINPPDPAHLPAGRRVAGLKE